MIQQHEFECLIDNDLEHMSFKDLLEIGKMQESNWKDYIIDKNNVFYIDDNRQFICMSEGNEFSYDISEFAFTQLCQRVGVPSAYVMKCFEHGKIDLALMNLKEWAQEYCKGLRIRVYDNTVRAVLSNTYVPFSNLNVLTELSNNISGYELKNILLTPDRLHLRFISISDMLYDENVKIGFTVDSSDTGRGSLNIKLYLYFEDISNGIVISKLGGTLFKQNHVGSKMTGGKLAMFNRSLGNIQKLTEKFSAILENSKQVISVDNFDILVESVANDLRMSENLLSVMKEQLKGRSYLELVKYISVMSKQFTFDNRYAYEQYAGNLFTSHSYKRRLSNDE